MRVFQAIPIISEIKRYIRYKKLRAYRRDVDRLQAVGVNKILLYASYFNNTSLDDLIKIFGIDLVSQAFFNELIDIYTKDTPIREHLWNTQAYKKYKDQQNEYKNTNI
jgi:hypothetical protein